MTIPSVSVASAHNTTHTTLTHGTNLDDTIVLSQPSQRVDGVPDVGANTLLDGRKQIAPSKAPVDCDHSLLPLPLLLWHAAGPSS
jgi:hypothetical protein